LPSETMIWQPEFTDKTLSRKPGAVHSTGVKVYFCDPQSPWQRGTNENTNGLIRQYFPKKTCLAQYTQHELDLVAAQLNNRPRKTLKFKTPKEIIERGVALTD
ncbi:IS30 family transposase, partial [Escherichia coli]|uniref:IS30 family transposase n=1 Tax=Escherichia coli TaxID=562 RepID=UPI001F4A7097